MNKSNDSELIEAFLSGNQSALNNLVKRWHKVFCNKAFWLVKDADLAKDIAQDSWTTIINKLHTLKDANKFNSWAMRIVYSKSLDALRTKTKERHRKQEYKLEQKNIDKPSNDNSVIEELLLTKIKELPQQQQTVIKLFYVEDYTIKQISDILNIRVGTVKSRLFHARETLKQILKNRIYEK